ncbi:glycosyltransferase family 4 protein [Geitlerinema sp. PCC 9228]|jgi:glycosyltransferase involved in cell wall biosynthesis|uniref:glycosyltransferase family 4 protein n=1 Tax=Geitlerinema sp. PCC 9228 TaxID=111611 RepID=UPI0008F9ABDB|nr:glycosyltransferase family 4 protein [Geitlerinema sp. PCC 9228]
MRIAQVSPLWERVPPPGYGGIELVVSQLTDELVRRGHEVTLFATGDSQTLARLESVTPTALRLQTDLKEPAAYEALQLSQILEQAHRFDIIHFHTGFGVLPYTQFLKTPSVHTLHNGFTPENRRVFHKYRDRHYISISDAQRQLNPTLNYVRTVHNGIDTSQYPFQPTPQTPPYLAFLGRMSPEKGPDKAIEVAKTAGLPLLMAGKVDVVDQEFFENQVKPHIDGQNIQYLGELTHQEKVELLGNATATLFPIQWNEPFGLVTIESMCTGTPVIASNRGAVPEIVARGKTGFVCDRISAMVEAVAQVSQIERQHCHEFVLRYFSVAAMVDKYEAAYEKVFKTCQNQQSPWERESRNGHGAIASSQLIPVA